jgi:hypothetical protein
MEQRIALVHPSVRKLSRRTAGTLRLNVALPSLTIVHLSRKDNRARGGGPRARAS